MPSIVRRKKPEIPVRPEKNQARVSASLMITLSMCLAATTAVCFALWHYSANTPFAKPYTKIADSNPVLESRNAAERPARCQEGEKYYDVPSESFLFCYPADWGNAVVTDARHSPQDEGSRWHIGFSAKPSVKAGLASHDWRPAGGQDPQCHAAYKAMPSRLAATSDWQYADDSSAAFRRFTTGSGHPAEEISDPDIGGACLRVYVTLESPRYRILTLSYYRQFGGGVIDTRSHTQNPLILISEADRRAVFRWSESVQGY
jgi:hypothetical protein